MGMHEPEKRKAMAQLPMDTKWKLIYQHESQEQHKVRRPEKQATQKTKKRKRKKRSQRYHGTKPVHLLKGAQHQQDKHTGNTPLGRMKETGRESSSSSSSSSNSSNDNNYKRDAHMFSPRLFPSLSLYSHLPWPWLGSAKDIHGWTRFMGSECLK